MQIIFNLNQDISWDVAVGDGKEVCHVEMKVGEVCIYRNNDAKTEMYYEAGSNFRFKSVQMSMERFRELIGSYFESELCEQLMRKISFGVEVTPITQKMYLTLSEIDSADRYMEYKNAFLEAKLAELTFLVLIGVAGHKTETRDRVLFSDGDAVEAVRALREQIQLKPYEDYAAPDVAESLSVSVSKLNRMFRGLYGISLHSYVTEQRLEYAVGLMEQGGYSVTEIALKSGYNNLSHFAKAFAGKYGMTPKKYIRQLKL